MTYEDEKVLYFNSDIPYNTNMMNETRNVMKNANLAGVGEVIRAYDFKPMVGRNDCFVEGVVEQTNSNEMGYSAYKITVTKDVFDGSVQPKGKHSRVGAIVFVPHEVSFMEYAGRVINLSK